MWIAVIGGSKAIGRPLELAYQVGSELAKREAGLVCGGLGGVMEAACKGAKVHGGITVGILPSDNASDANPYVDVPICTGMGYARNAIVVKSAQAVIAIDGAFGTLSEIGLALGEDIPVVALDTWYFCRYGDDVPAMILASDAKDAVEKALEAASQRGTPTESHE